jgi:hypothetical protein
MLDRLAIVPCRAADCGGNVTVRLGYAPAYVGERRLSLAPTIDALGQTCGCALSDDDIGALGALARRATGWPAPAVSKAVTVALR